MLRQTRETKGASVADAAEALFVKKSTVGAIESGCWERLPHPLYVKGYVKSYASYLGIVEAIETHLQRPSVDHQNGGRVIGTPGFRAGLRTFLWTALSTMTARLRDVVDSFHATAAGKRRALEPRF
jgi:hypothetical protein